MRVAFASLLAAHVPACGLVLGITDVPPGNGDGAADPFDGGTDASRPVDATLRSDVATDAGVDARTGNPDHAIVVARDAPMDVFVIHVDAHPHQDTGMAGHDASCVMSCEGVPCSCGAVTVESTGCPTVHLACGNCPGTSDMCNGACGCVPCVPDPAGSCMVCFQTGKITEAYTDTCGNIFDCSGCPRVYYAGAGGQPSTDPDAAGILANKVMLFSVSAVGLAVPTPSVLEQSYFIGGPLAGESTVGVWWTDQYPQLLDGGPGVQAPGGGPAPGNTCPGSDPDDYLGRYVQAMLVFGVTESDTLAVAESWPGCP